MTIGVGFVTSRRARRRVGDDKTVMSENLRNSASILGSYKARRDVQRCMLHLRRLSRSWMSEGEENELASIVAGWLMV